MLMYMPVPSSSFRCNNTVCECAVMVIFVSYAYFVTAHQYLQLYIAESAEMCGRSLLITSCACCHFLCEACCAYLTPYTTVVYLILTYYITILCTQDIMS